MKKTIAVILALFMMVSVTCMCYAQVAPDAYMELSVTGDWYIFSKDMEDEELLDAVGMSVGQINKILEDSSSESVIINSVTGAQVFVKVLNNQMSHDLWNIQGTDDAYLMENIDRILSEGFYVAGLDYGNENIVIQDSAYMKQITVHGSTFFGGEGHGIAVSGTFVNGHAIVFMMETAETEPTQEEVSQVKELLSGVSFTVIKDKDDGLYKDKGNERDVFHYILGGFGAIVVIIFCAYVIERMKHKDDEADTSEESEESQISIN